MSGGFKYMSPICASSRSMWKGGDGGFEDLILKHAGSVFCFQKHTIMMQAVTTGELGDDTQDLTVLFLQLFVSL